MCVSPDAVCLNTFQLHALRPTNYLFFLAIVVDISVSCVV